MLRVFEPESELARRVATRLQRDVYLLEINDDLPPDSAHKLAQYLTNELGWLVLIEAAAP